MQKWTRFLASLETPGGRLFVLVLLIIFIFLVATTLIITGHPISDAAKQMLIIAVSSLLGFTYGYLKANGKK